MKNVPAQLAHIEGLVLADLAKLCTVSYDSADQCMMCSPITSSTPEPVISNITDEVSKLWAQCNPELDFNANSVDYAAGGSSDGPASGFHRHL